MGDEDILELLEAEPQPTTELETMGWVVFLLTDIQLNPDQITAQLGVAPDRVQHPEPSERRPGIWQLNSRLPGQAPITEHFYDLLHRLVPVHRQLWTLAERYRLEFFCSIQKKGEATTPLVLPARMLLLLGYVGADIEIEVTDV